LVRSRDDPVENILMLAFGILGVPPFGAAGMALDY